MPLPASIRSHLRLPLVAAPMFLVSGPELVVGACRNGVIGALPCANARTVEVLADWIDEIDRALAAHDAAPWIANVVVHPTNGRLAAELDVLEEVRVPILMTALGGPRPIVERVHGWGGQVFADVNSVAFARKAAAAGVDGLVLVSSGAGGHTGPMNGLALLAAVREFFDGIVALGGGLSTGAAIRAVEVAGADLAIMGTTFIATAESLAEPAYKALLIDSTFSDLVLTNTVTSVPANWLRPTLIRAGLDPDDRLVNPTVDFGDSPGRAAQRARWKEVWSAGHGVGSIREVEPVAALIDRLDQEYAQACAVPAFR